MPLLPLAPDESRHVLKSALGAGEISDALADLIVAKAEGNPFFVEELGRAVREQGGPAAALAVPDTIQEVLLGRIGRLAPEDKRLLEIAAVVGKHVPFAIVHAAARATARSAHREAVEYLEQALAALARLPESRAKLEAAIDVRLDFRLALLPLGELGQILPYLLEAEVLAESLGDQHRLGRLCVFMAGQFYLTGAHDRALEYGRRAQAITEALRDFSLEVAPDAAVGQIRLVHGEYRAAAAVFRKRVDAIGGELIHQRV